eukprot:scaffold56_cov121-Skeletonema_marinoi.AAC.3
MIVVGRVASQHELLQPAHIGCMQRQMSCSEKMRKGKSFGVTLLRIVLLEIHTVKRFLFCEVIRRQHLVSTTSEGASCCGLQDGF